MADYVLLKQIEVEGKLFDVYVSNYRGEFNAVPTGLKPGHPNTVASDWLYDKLLPILKKRTKEAKTRVEVPFCAMSQGVLRIGTARGIHASNGKTLVTWSNGEKDQLERHVSRDTYTIPPQEVIEKVNAKAAEVLAYRETLLTLEKELDGMLKPYAMKPDYNSRSVDRTPTLAERVQAAITATIQGDEDAKDAVGLSVVK